MIEVNQELIEKYHRQECTPEECAAVESWLFEEDTEVILDLPADENKASHKAEIWMGIEEILPQQDLKLKQKIAFPYRLLAIAAILLVGLFIFFSYDANETSHKTITDLAINNTSAVRVKHLQYDHCNFSIAPHTRADINYQTGLINLSGSILIHPKEDFELFLSGNATKTLLKTGQTYILIRDEAENEHFFLVNKSNLTDLPPMVQRKIINTFNI